MAVYEVTIIIVPDMGIQTYYSHTSKIKKSKPTFCFIRSKATQSEKFGEKHSLEGGSEMGTDKAVETQPSRKPGRERE